MDGTGDILIAVMDGLKKYRQEANQALGDGIISQQESSHLERLRLGLSLGKHTASQILDEERIRQALAQNPEGNTCPHCGAKIDS